MKLEISKLNSINWDFENKNKYLNEMIWPLNCRKYYSYPATFIPEIPFTLIEILTKPGDLVFDPFGGIGTTFLQALIQKRRAYSIDNNLVVSQINKDFFNLMNPFIDIKLCLHKVIDVCSQYKATVNYRTGFTMPRNELQDWYETKTYNEIAFLIKYYDKLKNSLNNTEKSLFHLCLSNILTTASSQNGGWAYIADNVKPKKLIYKEAIERFKFCAKQVVKDFDEYKILLEKDFKEFYQQMLLDDCIRNDDFINMEDKLSSEGVDLVITSPPYPKMIDYVKSQRLSYYFEEIDFNDDLHKEIGARYYRNKKNSIEEYVIAMKKCNERLKFILKNNGYLCYILPFFSEERDSDRSAAIKEVISHCEDIGLKKVYSTQRFIPGTRRSNNIKWASLKEENILILEKR